MGEFRNAGISVYLLALLSIGDYCRERGIPFIIRGSAVSSLTLHILGLSPVDPIGEGLPFERFLHGEKTSLPDIDVDLPSHRRDEVIEWVFDKFGRDRVAMVSAHHRFQARSALRKGLKALGFGEKISGKHCAHCRPRTSRRKIKTC